MIKVSVVVPIFNIKNYIETMVKSVLAQTMTDWELLLVDDGSTDGTKEMIAEYEKQDERIRAIYHEANRGVAAARGSGCAKARGEYVCFFDGDDWIEPETLEQIYARARAKDADMVCFAYVKEYEKKSRHYHFEQRRDVEYSGKEAVREMHRRKNVHPHAWNKLYKRELFLPEMFGDLKYLGEDYSMNLDFLERCSVIVQTDTPYYHYSLRRGSSLDVGFSPFYKNGYEFYQKKEVTLLEKYPEYTKAIKKYHLIEQMAIVVAMFKNDVYDHEIRKKVTSEVRHNLLLLTLGKDVDFKFRISAVALSAHYSILQIGYKLVYYNQRKNRR